MRVSTPGTAAKAKPDLSSASLHIIAMASMLLDHAMKTVVEYDGWLFVLGRLAFPIFAFLAAEGCFYTRDPKKYGLRLFVFAALSEVPYDLMKSEVFFDPYDQNVIWTFLIAFLCLRGCQLLKARVKRKFYIPGAVLLGLAGFLAATLLSTDYGGMGVLTVFVFYFLRTGKGWRMPMQLLLLAAINILFLGGFGYGVTFRISGQSVELPLQGFALLALVPIWLYRGRQGYHSKPFQYFCYAFYPVHMLALFLLSRTL
jgi:hypothetical protein